jgi:hypothetical protein
MLSVNYAECRKQALYAECHYAECRYSEYRGAQGGPRYNKVLKNIFTHSVLSLTVHNFKPFCPLLSLQIKILSYLNT